MPATSSPGLPFRLERYNLLFMGLLSFIVVAGTLYSLVHKTHTFNVLLSDPQTALSMAATDGETLPKIPLSFLANRRNLLNRIFTKFAWFWTTAAFIAQAVTLRSSPITSTEASTAAQATSSSAEQEKAAATTPPGSGRASQQSMLAVSVLRFAVATALWIFFARWFLGPSLMERVRHYSGATCVPISIAGTSSTNAIEAQYCYTGSSLSAKEYPHLFGEDSATDSIVRPKWKGGHDISGHTYILIISSLYLLEEITPFLPYLLPSSLHDQIAKVIPKTRWAASNPFIVTAQQSQSVVQRNTAVLVGIFGLLSFWTMSLAVTAVYFHTAQEKISGLLVALTASLLIPKGG